MIFFSCSVFPSNVPAGTDDVPIPDDELELSEDEPELEDESLALQNFLNNSPSLPILPNAAVNPAFKILSIALDNPPPPEDAEPAS